MAISKQKRIEQVVKRIEDAFPERLVNWNGRCSEKQIKKAEEILGIQLPVSFRRFVELKGGGGYENLYILGIPPKGDLSKGANAVTYWRLFQKEDITHPLPVHLVPIEYDEDLRTPMCLDSSRRTRGGECPVVAYSLSTGDQEQVAKDFISYYEEYASAFIDQANR